MDAPRAEEGGRVRVAMLIALVACSACSTCDVCAVGSGCLSDADCGDTELCNLFDHSAGETCGTCSPRACADGCGPGMICDGDGTCTAAFNCVSDADCADGQVCQRSACASDCVDPRSAGERCVGYGDGTDSCLNFFSTCSEDLSCVMETDGADGVCVEDARDAICSCVDSDDWDFCVRACGVPCLPIAQEGQECDSFISGCSLSRACAEGLFCVEEPQSGVERNEGSAICRRP